MTEQQIKDLVLFISSASGASIDCAKKVGPALRGLSVVRLDTPEVRARARGEHFSITQVPTLLVCTGENNIRLFVGAAKILRFADALLSQGEGDEADEERPRKKKKKRVKRPPERRGESKVEIELIDAPDPGQPPPTENLLLGVRAPGAGKSRLATVKQQAAAMEREWNEREKQLGQLPTGAGGV